MTMTATEKEKTKTGPTIKMPLFVPKTYIARLRRISAFYRRDTQDQGLLMLMNAIDQWEEPTCQLSESH